jgi:hypothetical protein
MQLKLKRSQRAGGMLGGTVIFVLDARADLNEDERGHVKKYNLGKSIVYDSEARKKHGEAVGSHVEASRGVSTTKGLYRIARASVSAAMAVLSLRITIDSLVNGQHVECKSLDELIGAQNAILEACESLKSYLDLAQTFDGREEIFEY